ncbi:MAG: TolC family protein, partial [Gammaproteobacteria bacterium]|nr:TolC family protein [Gammaproteobacteria bacterium]
VREAWWALQRAQTEHGLTQDRLLNARRLAADVARRVRAGDMARADQFQADGAVAQAEAALAEATGARDVAQAALVAWGGNRPLADAAEPEAEALPAAGLPADHPAVADWQDQAEVARRAADLAAVQTRANPELTVAATRAREQSGERYLQSLTVGVRVPLGGGDRSRAKELAARADALDAELRAGVERNRLAAEVAAASARVRATQAQREAVARHAALARDTRGFIDKAFRLGEADLPTRLRVELDAVQAERQLALARIDAAAAVSTLRQALGLLPQ